MPRFLDPAWRHLHMRDGCCKRGWHTNCHGWANHRASDQLEIGECFDVRRRMPKILGGHRVTKSGQFWTTRFTVRKTSIHGKENVHLGTGTRKTSGVESTGKRLQGKRNMFSSKKVGTGWYTRNKQIPDKWFFVYVFLFLLLFEKKYFIVVYVILLLFFWYFIKFIFF